MKSIVTEFEGYSVFSEKRAECSHHLIFGRYRKEADEDGLIIPLTNDEHTSGNIIERIHDNIAAEKLSRIAGQLAFEKEFYKKIINPEKDIAREAFRKRYGKSFL